VILVVTAIPEELRPIRARLSSPGVVVAATGDGRVRAEAGMRALLDRHRPDAWIGAGLAGAATPGVPSGTLVVARNVGDAAWASRVLGRGGAREAFAVSVDRIAASPREKAALATGPAGSVVTIDTETSSWAAAAGALPGLVVRVVSDAVEEEIPAFVAAASSEAGVDRRRIALHALAHPSAIGKLVSMRRRARTCAERLAEFLAELARRGFDRS
jgi:adenosylhomocysteine nucleosidase